MKTTHEVLAIHKNKYLQNFSMTRKDSIISSKYVTRILDHHSTAIGINTFMM